MYNAYFSNSIIYHVYKENCYQNPYMGNSSFNWASKQGGRFKK